MVDAKKTTREELHVNIPTKTRRNKNKSKDMEQRRIQTQYEGSTTIKSKDDISATKNNIGREIG